MISSDLMPCEKTIDIISFIKSRNSLCKLADAPCNREAMTHILRRGVFSMRCGRVYVQNIRCEQKL